jgi:hypothetical protein
MKVAYKDTLVDMKGRSEQDPRTGGPSLQPG